MPGESHGQKSLAGYTSIGWQRVGLNFARAVLGLQQDHIEIFHMLPVPHKLSAAQACASV